MQGRASTSSRSAVYLRVGLYVTRDNKGGGVNARRRERSGAGGKERVVREATVRCCGWVKGYGGQLGPVLNGSDRLVQSANEC